MSNYTKENLVPISVSDVQKGTLAIKIGNEFFVAGTNTNLPQVSVTPDVLLSGETAINSDGQIVYGTINDGSVEVDGNVVTIYPGYISEVQEFVAGPDLSEVTVTSDKMLKGVLALNSDGELISGSINTVELQKSGNTVSISKGYTDGGSVTVESESYPNSSVTVDKNIVTITGGLISSQEVTIPMGSVQKDGALIKINEGYVEQNEIELQVVTPTLTGNVFKITEGYVDDTYELTVPIANITETDTKLTIGVGYNDSIKEFALTSGGSTGGDGISQLVKVSEFIAPYDAYSVVESIEVSGFGETTVFDEPVDYSDWNGTYVVTPETAHEHETENRIYKHQTKNYYIYRIFCNDNQEHYWVFDTSTGFTDYVYEAWFTSSTLESGDWYYYENDVTCAITLNKTIGTYPDQELVLKVQPATGSSTSNDLRTWEFGNAMDLTKYETTPVEGAMHVLLGGELLSSKVYPTTTQGVNGLLFYAPLTSANNDLLVGSYTASKPFEYSEYGAELESLYLLTDVPVSALQGDFTFFAEVTVHNTSHEHPIFAAYDSNYMIGLDTTGNAYSMYASSTDWDWLILTGNNNYSPDETSISGRGSIATTQDVTQKVAMTRNGDIWELYVDNVLSLRRNRPGTIRASGYIALHRWGSGDGSMTNAPTALKNVKIYSRGMTAEEIAQL